MKKRKPDFNQKYINSIKGILLQRKHEIIKLIDIPDKRLYKNKQVN